MNFFKNINSYVLMVILILLFVLAIVLFIIVLVIKKSKKEAQELRELDYLTKIYNRSYYYKQCKLFLEETNSEYVIISFDITKFKLVNEYYGTEAADNILIRIALKLKEFYKSDRIKRFGRIESDKFSWIMTYNKDKIKRVFDELDMIRETLNYSISFNIGVYFIEYNKMDVEQAYSRANLAVKSIKNNFESSICYFDNDMIKKLEKEQFYVNSLDKALEEEQIMVYFQPKYDLLNDSIGGAEALVRWKHPTLGMIPPSEFVPALENNGLITKIDKYIWQQTCRYIKKWREAGFNPPPISVNISKIDLLEKDLPIYIENLVRKYSIPFPLLELEITESAYVDNSVDVASIIKNFKNKGFTILMDDFGSGYSSLNTLRQFPVDVLKIDLKFLTDFDDSIETVKGKKIIESIVQMAKQLGLKIVVEGTETIEQVQYIKSIGCDMAQGYYFSKPIEASMFKKMFTDKSINVTTKSNVTKIDDNGIWNKNIVTEDFFNSTTCALGIFMFRRERLEAVRLNENYFSLIDSTRKDFYLKNRNLLEYINPLDLDKFLNALSECIKTRGSVNINYRRINSNGNMKYISACITYVNSTDKSVNHFFLSLEDKTNEFKLNNDLDRIINSFDYGFIKCSLDDNKILLYNNKLLELLEINNEEFISLYNYDFKNLIALDDLDNFIECTNNISINNTAKIFTMFKTNSLYINVIVMCKKVLEEEKLYGYFSIIKNYQEN